VTTPKSEAPGTVTLRRALQALVIAGGVAFAVTAVTQTRFEDWPAYVVFFVVYSLLALPDVEVLPGLRLPIPNMAVSIGFLYVAGLPVLLLRDAAAVLGHFWLRFVPTRWRENLGGPNVGGGRGILPEVFFRGAEDRTVMVVEWATFAIGLGTRWLVVRAITGSVGFAAEPAAIAAAELAGNAAWGLLSILPVYPDRPLLPLSTERRSLRGAIADITVVIVMALTPFVFLIAYGYVAHGLEGAAAWSLSTLGLHFMFRRLNERRLVVEDQKVRLEILNRELERRERLSAIGKMSSVVSHQILHQLGLIGIYADLIRNADEGDDAAAALRRVKENAGAIEGALRDVNRVLTDLLVFSKDLRLNLYGHDLATVLTESVEQCTVEAAAKGVELQVHSPQGVSIRLDKLKMKQALDNVVRNAIEVAPAGSTITVEGEVRDGRAEIRVSDLGPGIPERDREAVFAPFFTTKEQGTGLGLAIAREFTEAHGGTIEVESNERPGTTFVFRLPLSAG
jgi:signal transduction histidine kinase